MSELKQWIKCLTERHEWKEEGTGKHNKIVCFCKYCGKVITIEKIVNEREQRAKETDGNPYGEAEHCFGLWSGQVNWFVPYYKLVRQYAGETIANNYKTAKQIQANNTMEGLIKKYQQNMKYAEQQAKKQKKTIATRSFRIIDEQGNVLHKWTA